MAFRITTSINSYISSSIFNNRTLPSNIYELNNAMYIDYFLPRGTNITDDMNIVYLGDLIVISEKVTPNPLMDIYKELLNVDTVIMGGLYTINGKVNAEFRFHNSDMHKIEAIIETILSSNHQITIDYLGKYGLSEALDNINKRIKLSSVNFSFKSKDEFKAEVKLNGKLIMMKDNKLSISNGISEQSLLESINKARLPFASFTEETRSGRKYCTIVMPAEVVSPFLLRLFNLKNIFDDLHLESIESNYI